MRVDPRPAAIERRLAGVSRRIAVTGGKGGIGKSLVAATLAAVSARSGRATGLLDLDLTGPCAHLVLGASSGFPEEPFGVEPVSVHGVRFMSITPFGGERPVPLRGSAVTDALTELLAITNWGELELLVIDMPPGLGDATLDVEQLIDRLEFLVVTTPSRVVRETVRRTLDLFRRRAFSACGVVENMSRDDPSAGEKLASEAGLPFLGALPFDPEVETASGDPDRLLETRFARAVSDLAATL